MAAPLRPLYLIGGTDGPKVRLAVERLRNRFDPGAVEVLHATARSGEEAVEACYSLGLFGGDERLVVVEDVDEWKAGDARAIADYAKDPTPGTVLALVARELKKDSALARAIGKAGEVLVYDAPRRRDLPAWVARQFEALGVEADRDACRLLVDVVGDSPDLLRNEIEKLATWAGGGSVREEDVRAVASASAEISAFELTDAWGRRDVAAVLAAAESVLERGGPRELSRITPRVAAHVARVRLCQAVAAEGGRPRDAAARLKLHPFVAEKAFAHAANYSADELAQTTIRLAQLDHALKGGSRLAPELELERTLIEITAPRAARAAVA